MIKIKNAPEAELRMGTVNILRRPSNYHDSKRIAAENGGRLLTLSEFIIAINRDPILHEKSKKSWYWLGDEPGLNLSGHCRIDYEKGIVTPIPGHGWTAFPLREIAYAHRGSGQLAVGVDYGRYDRHLFVSAGNGPAVNAPRIVFIVPPKNAQKSDSKCASLAALVRETVPSVMANLEPSVKPEVFEKLRHLHRAAEPE